MLKLVISTIIFMLSCTAFGQGIPSNEAPGGYQTFVVAQDVEARYIDGVLRFCEHQNLRGMVCGREQRIFGKRIRTVQDWWSPETYVQAVTGLSDFQVTMVTPAPDGRSLVIYFKQ